MLQLPEPQPILSLQGAGSQAGAWEPAKAYREHKSKL
jgi:hypothetical protein